MGMDTPGTGAADALEALEIDLEVAQCGEILGSHNVAPTPGLVSALWGWAEGLRNAAPAAPRRGLTYMPLSTLTACWMPGSAAWPWEAEYADLATDPQTAVVAALVAAGGIGYGDATDPITLGHDGRVWDGHHRIYLAHTLGIAALWVALAEPE